MSGPSVPAGAGSAAEISRLGAELEAARLDAAAQAGMLEAARRDARLAARRLELHGDGRNEALRQRAAAQLEAARQRAAVLESNLEAVRERTARLEAARSEAARLAAIRQEAARQALADLAKMQGQAPAGSNVRSLLANRAADAFLSGVLPPAALVELVLSATQQPARQPGPSRRPRPQLVIDDDAECRHLRPDPRQARTGAELAAALREFRQWSGEPSLSAIAEGCGQRVSRSTLHRTLSSRALPSFDAVMAVVIGCGGAEEDKKKFASAWRMIRAGTERPAARRLLRSVPAEAG